MNIINLSEKNSILQHFIAELRDKNIQKDPMRFRRNLERIGEIMSYEISKTMQFQAQTVESPLGSCEVPHIEESIVISTILRAGLPFHAGFLNTFDRAENAFISAYRKYISKTEFDVHVEYISSPDLSDKTLIVADPMLASGLSFELAYEGLLSKGKPSKSHMCAIIASQQGIDYLEDIFKDDKNLTLWVAAIDPELNDKSYIIPGLGDAGDLAYGIKQD